MNQAKLVISLRLKLFAAFALVAVVPLFILAVVNGRNTQQILINDANQSLYLVANQVAVSLDDFLDNNLNELILESCLPVLQNYFARPATERPHSQEEQHLLAFLTTLSGKNEHVRAYGVLDTEGIVLLDSHPAYQNQNEADRDFIKHFAENPNDTNAYISAVQFRPNDDTGVLFFTIPILNDSGERIGFLRSEYDAVVLQELLAAQNNLAGPGSFGVLFDEVYIHLAHGIEPAVNTIPIAHFSPEIETALQAAWRLRDLPDDELYPMQLDELETGLDNAVEYPFFEATDMATGEAINQVAVAPLNQRPWIVAFFQPQTIFLAPANAQVRTSVFLGLLIGITAVVAAYSIGGLLVRPLTDLNETVTEFSAGDMLARSQVTSSDEIGVLAVHFNEMAERVGILLTSLENRTEALQQEVNEHQLTEDRLRQQRRFLRQVVNINPSFIFAKDRDGRFVMVNQTFADIYDTDIENMLDKTDADFNPDAASVEQFRRDDLQVFTSGEELFIPEQHTVNTIGQERWWQTIKRPLVTENGTISEVLTIVTEITERKQNEETLRIARDRALEASRVKSEILARANHELQTPLGAILGYAEMMETGYFGDLTAKQKEILQKIIGRTNNLTTLIQNMLDQANLEARRFHYNLTTFLPQDLLYQMHSHMDDKAQVKGLTLSSEIAAGFPSILTGDPGRLQQILTNLVENGIKFTQKGTIHVTLFQPHEITWAIAVSDTGPGIPQEAQAYIFEPFRQVDGSITRLHQGFGLGLSLVKELALTMEGDVHLSSTPGKGSTFTIILPYNPAREEVY
ncbi:MAG: PAS domain-containing protein [Chloroflexi bacterium]|nr:PAS domain-containing protein [Chloroflexota bacterium]